MTRHLCLLLISVRQNSGRNRTHCPKLHLHKVMSTHRFRLTLRWLAQYFYLWNCRFSFIVYLCRVQCYTKYTVHWVPQIQICSCCVPYKWSKWVNLLHNSPFLIPNIFWQFNCGSFLLGLIQMEYEVCDCSQLCGYLLETVQDAYMFSMEY